MPIAAITPRSLKRRLAAVLPYQNHATKTPFELPSFSPVEGNHRHWGYAYLSHTHSTLYRDFSHGVRSGFLSLSL